MPAQENNQDLQTMPAQEDARNLLDQYLEKQTSRLTVTDNYIWTIIAIAWLVVVGFLSSRHRACTECAL